MYSTGFWCLFVVLLVFWLYFVTTVTPFIEQSGYAMKPKITSKTTNRHQNAVEYIVGKTFLFISFKKSKV